MDLFSFFFWQKFGIPPADGPWLNFCPGVRTLCNNKPPRAKVTVENLSFYFCPGFLELHFIWPTGINLHPISNSLLAPLAPHSPVWAWTFVAASWTIVTLKWALLPRSWGTRSWRPSFSGSCLVLARWVPYHKAQVFPPFRSSRHLLGLRKA